MEERRGEDGVDVVAIVASAGGLQALSTVLGALSSDVPAAVVVQLHLGGHGSQLVPILSKRIDLPVDWARDGETLRPGCVLVAPPRRRLEILPDGSCAVGSVNLAAGDRPHDILLTSLADSFGGRGMAVVLTGMGRDGAAGVRAVKAAGGLVVVQSEDSADQPSMPRAAIESGAADLVLPLQEIGLMLLDVAMGRPLPVAPTEAQAVRDVFGTEGVTAAMAAEIDWSRTPLGR